MLIFAPQTIHKVVQSQQRTPGQPERAGTGQAAARKGVNVKSKNGCARLLFVYSLYQQVVFCFMCNSCKNISVYMGFTHLHWSVREGSGGDGAFPGITWRIRSFSTRSVGQPFIIAAGWMGRGGGEMVGHVTGKWSVIGMKPLRIFLMGWPSCLRRVAC